MDDMEEKLGAILGNPQMMQQIMSMAQALGQSQNEPQKQEPPRQEQPKSPGLDMAMLQKLIGIAKQSGIDKNQQNLLHAVGTYLCRERISNLEKAMRAGKIAAIASSALGSGGLQQLLGR